MYLKFQKHDEPDQSNEDPWMAASLRELAGKTIH